MYIYTYTNIYVYTHTHILCCNTMQHSCNTLATRYTSLQHVCRRRAQSTLQHTLSTLQHTVTRCCTLRQATTRCNALQHTCRSKREFCNSASSSSLQHNTMLHSIPGMCDAVCGSLQQCVATCCSVLQGVAVCCSALQCGAVCCIFSLSLKRNTMSSLFSLHGISCMASISRLLRITGLFCKRHL